MAVSNISSDLYSQLSASSNSAAFAPENEMGQAEFLLLLTTQLKNQDPNDPVDPSSFVSDLTEMSQLDSTNKMNESISAMVEGFQGMQTMQAAALIGKNVQVEGKELSYSAGEEVDIKMSLTEALTDVTIVISDDDGVVKELDAGDLETGDNIVSWNGEDSSGIARDSGQFTLTVYGTDSEGELQSINTIVPSKVNSIAISEDGTTTLTLATGELVSMDSVRQISI
jgi:flagellar basal-body rod modification protein FlgD